MIGVYWIFLSLIPEKNDSNILFHQHIIYIMFVYLYLGYDNVPVFVYTKIDGPLKVVNFSTLDIYYPT